MMRLIGIFAVILMSHQHTDAEDVRTNELLQQGIQAYQSALDTSDRSHRVQLFTRAEAAFAQLIEQQVNAPVSAPVSVELYLNLGNAALGAEHLGKAVLAYRRAATVAPRNARVQQNLQHARSLLPQWIPKPDNQAMFGSFFDWAIHLQRSDWLGLAAVAFLAALILAAIYVRTGSIASRNVALVIACIWLAMLWQAFTESGSSTARDAVVVAEEVFVRSADSTNAPPRFPQPLAGGAELQIITDRGDWIRVQLYDGREGWLPSSTVKPIG